MGLYNPTNITIPSTTSTTGSKTTNSLSTTASKLVDTNVNRKGLTIYNKLSVTLYVDYVDTVSNTSYAFPVYAGGYYEMPNLYTGALWGILASGTGSVEVRELV